MNNQQLEQLSALATVELLHKFNQLTGLQVKRFASRSAAIARFKRAVAKDKRLAQKLDVMLTTSIAVIDDGGPIPTVEDIFDDVAAEGMAQETDPSRKPKDLTNKPTKKRRPVRLQSKRIADGKAKVKAIGDLALPKKPVKAEVRAIKDSKQGRVWANGKAVKPENAERALAGEALSGVLCAPVKSADRMGEKRLNFNYKQRDLDIKEPREGTARYLVEEAIAENGITVDEVMEMFPKLSYDQAVYRIRDLHYTAGHGLELRGGRVYIKDDKDE